MQINVIPAYISGYGVGLSRISGLDGVRALAIAFVIGGHILQHNPNPWLSWIFGGQDGVGLFFILSGFLVTSLLLREHRANGRVDIPHFYFRRALRILPPVLAYLLAVIVIGWRVGEPVPGRVVSSVLFFYHNMTHEGTWMLEHTWSLAVEEQFYLLWPLLVVWTLGISWRTLIYASLALIALAPAIRVGGHLMHWQWMHAKESYLLPTRMDALLAGSVMACLAGADRFERLYKRLEPFYWLAAIFLFVISPYLTRRYWYSYDYTAGYLLDSLVGAFFILWLSRNEKHLLGRVANWKPIATVGVMSYSIYLWQTLGTHYSKGLLRLGLVLLFISLMAYLSFRFVERPAASARTYLERRLFRDKSGEQNMLEESALAAKFS